MCETRGEDTAAGVIFGGLVGTIGGFIVGSFDKSERWVSLQPRAKVSVTPTSRGVALRLGRAF